MTDLQSLAERLEASADEDARRLSNARYTGGAQEWTNRQFVLGYRAGLRALVAALQAQRPEPTRETGER